MVGGPVSSAPQAPVQQCKETQDPSTVVHSTSGTWDGCCCCGHHCLRHPALGINTAPLLPEPPPLHHDSCHHQDSISLKSSMQHQSPGSSRGCAIHSMSSQQLQYHGPALPAPHISFSPLIHAACAASAVVHKRMRQDTMLRYSSWRRSPEHYQHRELIKVMSGDKETGCQSSSSSIGGSKPEKLHLKSSSTEM